MIVLCPHCLGKGWVNYDQVLAVETDKHHMCGWCLGYRVVEEVVSYKPIKRSRFDKPFNEGE